MREFELTTTDGRRLVIGGKQSSHWAIRAELARLADAMALETERKAERNAKKKEELRVQIAAKKKGFYRIRAEYNLCKNPVLAKELLGLFPPDEIK